MDVQPEKSKSKINSSNGIQHVKNMSGGYRPNHIFEYNDNGQLLQTYIGDIIFEGTPTIEPGEEREVTVRFLMNQPIERYLDKGRIWWIHEGPKQIGQAEII